MIYVFLLFIVKGTYFMCHSGKGSLPVLSMHFLFMGLRAEQVPQWVPQAQFPTLFHFTCWLCPKELCPVLQNVSSGPDVDRWRNLVPSQSY